MAVRAGATITEAEGSHVIMVSQAENCRQRDPDRRSRGSRPDWYRYRLATEAT
jgi:hypothetical protein